jgi:hypothetical protein
MTNGSSIFTGLENRIRSILGNIEQNQFSEPAFIRLQNVISDFVNDIITESIDVAGRRGVDIISEVHVEIAHEYLLSRRRRKIYDLIESLGGVFLGVALGGVYLLISGTTGLNVILFTIICIVIGMLLIAVGYRH